MEKLRKVILPFRLCEINLHATTCQITTMDFYFLTYCKQYVRTSRETATIITVNTGGPQDCILSAFLVIIYTNAMPMTSKTCQIITYVIGLVNNTDETQYKNAIKYVTVWCSTNYLDLNVAKTKEMMFKFIKNKNTKIPVQCILQSSATNIQASQFRSISSGMPIFRLIS